jgi:hypothetical protein
MSNKNERGIANILNFNRTYATALAVVAINVK